MRKEHRSWLVVATVTALVVFLGMRTLGTTTQAQEKQVRPQKLFFSRIESPGGPSSLMVFRANVPGGWLVLVHENVEKSRNRPGRGTDANVLSVESFSVPTETPSSDQQHLI